MPGNVHSCVVWGTKACNVPWTSWVGVCSAVHRVESWGPGGVVRGNDAANISQDISRLTHTSWMQSSHMACLLRHDRTAVASRQHTMQELQAEGRD